MRVKPFELKVLSLPWCCSLERGVQLSCLPRHLTEAKNYQPPGGWTSTCWSTEGILFPFYHPLDNQWRRSSIRHLGTRPLGVAVSPDGLDHISRRVFDKWKHSTRLKRSSTLQLDSKIRKELNLDHSSLEFLQEPLIPKTPPQNTCFELELLQPCSKKEDPVTLRQKGLETIAILSQDNFAIAYTDGSSDRSLSNEGAVIILLLRDVTEFDCPRIITSTIARLRTEHLKSIKIHPDKTRSYVQCKHCPDLQLTPNHFLECPAVATKLLKMGMVPLRDSLRELLYSPDAPRIAEAVIKTFDGI
ncbi:hypothetical protein TNCV_2098101 [Trichonephila clavipes]|nr:hypothetical protein TNCV_2098101 [Trichonephila clavipes]